MKLYLMRHGHSPTFGEAGVARDSERPLSPQGRSSVKASAQILMERAGKPALIVHSPLKRAVQTAAEAAAVIKPKNGIEVLEELSNAFSAQQAFEALKDSLAASGEMVAVGHQPQLGELATFLCGRIFELRPAGIIALEVDGSGAQPLWSFNEGDPA